MGQGAVSSRTKNSIVIAVTSRSTDFRLPDAARTRLHHRRIAVALSLAVAIGVPALYFVPLVVKYAEGTSSEAALVWANRNSFYNGVTYALVSQYEDSEGRPVYRVASNTDPVVYREVRCLFRWLPEMYTLPGAPVPSMQSPGPYYETANQEEFEETYARWRLSRGLGSDDG